MLNKRSHALEILDLGKPYYTDEEYRNCHRQLERIGRYLGGDQATLKTLKELKFTPQSILDVGCGSGHFTARLAKHYPQTNVKGIDISQEALDLAHENQPLPNLQFSRSFLHEIPEQFDVVTATLVTHHLSDQALIAFLQQAYQKAKRAVILNDLHRHFLATASFAAIAPLFFYNRLIWHDGLLSIKRSFTKKEWWHYLEAAGINLKDCQVTWEWAFRWIVTIHKT